MTPEEMQRLLAEARTAVPSLDASEVLDLPGDDDVLFLDVREAEERRMGYINPSRHISFSEIVAVCTSGRGAELGLPSDKKMILVYCASGLRSLIAAKLLQDAGCEKLFSLVGGLQSWSQAGGAVKS